MEDVVLMRGTAIAEGHGDTALVLLKAGAETDKKDATGALALDLAPDAKVSLPELSVLAEVLICPRSGITSCVLQRKKVSSYDILGVHLLNEVSIHHTAAHSQFRGTGSLHFQENSLCQVTACQTDLVKLINRTQGPPHCCLSSGNSGCNIEMAFEFRT